MLFSPYVSNSFVIISSVFFICMFFAEAKKGMQLNDYIHHFEPLFYDHRHLQEQHRHSKTADNFSLKFTAHQRFFHLRLRRDTSVFAEDTEFLSTTKTVSYDTSRALTGYLDGEEDSFVEAVITSSGLLNGLVRVGQEEFYIEPAVSYFDPSQYFHSVIYKLSDVHFPQGNITCLSHIIKPFAPRSKIFSGKKISKRHSSRATCKSTQKCSSLSEQRHLSISKTSYKKPRIFRKRRSTNMKESESEKNIHSIQSNPHSGLFVGSENSVDLRSSKFVHNVRHHRAKSKTTFIDAAVNSNSVRSISFKERSGNSYYFLSNLSVDVIPSSTGSNQLSALHLTQPNSATFKKFPAGIQDAGIHFKYEVTSSTMNTGSRSSEFQDALVTKFSAPSEHLNSLPGELLNSHNEHVNNFNFIGLYSGQNLKSKKFRLDHLMDSLTDKISPRQMFTTNPPTSEMFLSKTVDSKQNSHRPIVFTPNSNSANNDVHTSNVVKNPPYWRELDALHYTEDGRTGSSEPYGVRSIQRTQWTEERGQRHVAVDRRKSTCLLYLQADHLFYQRMGSEEACIEAMTRHVQRVNSIYRMTDFDQDGRPDNISFLIKRIKVHTTPDDADYRFVGSYNVEKFLELFSEDDYDAFCLAYMFTYRDFEGGTLGLAWTGDLKNAGGVCEKNGHYRGSLKSLNTGIITLLNYGKHVPPVVSHVTLAHEIGHNFGSPHDPEDDQHCTPGGENGNYIMFARATSGDKRNNNRFSPCSLKSINAVLNTKARSVKGCFTEPLDAVCGNEVVEGTEECDCGWEEDCHEPCCFPMQVNPPQDQPPCRLRPAAFCSPSQGPCCSHDCRLKYGVMCREDNGCRSASYCDGQGPQCPPSTNKPNRTVCSEEFVCYNGECTGSICMAYGLESCQCIRTIHDPFIRSCELCCKLPGDESSCKSSFEWNIAPYDVPDLFAKPGAPCDNYNGYCDVYQSCREIDPSGPLATLRKLLLTPEGAVILKRWLAERWWSVLLLFFAISLTAVITVRLIIHGQTKNFLSTILPHQNDFNFCHSRSSSHSQATYMVTASSRTTNSIARPRISSAPENGWV